MISKKQFRDMPKKLQQALILVLIYFFISLIKILLISIFLNISDSDPEESVIRFTLEIILVGYLVFKIKGRKNWAKLILLVLFLLNALFLFYSFITEALWRDTVLISPITAILLIIDIIILTFLFNKSSDRWFKNSEKNQLSEEGKNIRKVSKRKYALILPILLSTFGFILGFIKERNLGIGTGGVVELFFLFIALILGLALIVLIILLYRGKKKGNQNLISVSKISLYIISIPMSYIIGFFISKIF